MTKLREYALGSLKVLLMGPAGTGKTLLAATLGSRATFLDLNNGLASASTFKDKWRETRLDIDVKQCWGADLGPDAVYRKAEGFINTFIKDPTQQALVVDGLSDLAEASLGMVLAISGKWGKAQSATQQEWGTAIGQIERLLWKLRATPKLVVVIAHTQLIEQEGAMKEVLAIYGKALPGKILAAFDEVWYTKVSGSGASRKFALQSVSSSGVQCKTRRQLPDGCDMNDGLEALLAKVGWTWPTPAGAATPAAAGAAPKPAAPLK